MGFRDQFRKGYVDEPIVLFKNEIFDFHIAILLAHPETKIKCTEKPESVDKYQRRMIISSFFLSLAQVR